MLWINQVLLLSPCLLLLPKSPRAATWGKGKGQESQLPRRRALVAKQLLDRGLGEGPGGDCLVKEHEGPWGPCLCPGRGLLLAGVYKEGCNPTTSPGMFSALKPQQLPLLVQEFKSKAEHGLQPDLQEKT